jgi:hypothetical protein
LRGSVEPKQYVSLIFGQHCRANGIAVSMGSKADAFDCDDLGAIELV